MVSITQRAVGNTDLTISELGLGCASLAGVASSVSDEDARSTLSAAVTSGVGYFDTAPFYGYGRSERLVGDALRHNDGQIRLSTKVGRLLKPCGDPLSAEDPWPDALPMRPHYDYTYEGIMRSFEDSLQRLGLSSIDIIYMHDIGSLTHGNDPHATLMRTAMSEGYRAMATLRENGLVGAIGLGVNECEVCIEALDYGDWDCFLLAGRYTLLEQASLDILFPKCIKSGTSIVIGGPFNSGVLVGGRTYNYEAVPPHIVDRVISIERVCNSHDIPMASAALQFPLRNPLVSSVIPGPRTVTELKSTLGWYELDIPDSLWSDLKNENLMRLEAP